MSSFAPGWLQKQTIDMVMAARLREIGEHQGRAELGGVHALASGESLRSLTAEHSAVAVSRIGGIENPTEQANYRALLLQLQDNAAKLPVKSATIRNLHRSLFAETGKPAGEYLDEETALAVEQLCASYLAQESLIDPVLLAGAFVLDLYNLHPFPAGNGRAAQLAAIWLLQRQGCDISRFVSLARILEETKDECDKALARSSVGWSTSGHALGPWWSYWLKLLVLAYRTAASRVQVLAKRRGAKTDLVLCAIKSLPGGFTLRQIQQQVPGCGIELIRKICKAEKAAGRLRCLGRGPNALWRRSRKLESS